VHLTDMEMAKKLAEKVAEYGGRAFFVGGFVRDTVKGESTKDIDIEIHGITPSTLGNILDSLGKKIEIGEKSIAIRRK